MAATLGTVQPFRYRGYVYDEETGLYYLRSRYYNPSESKFINADCVIGVSMKVFDMALYSYAANNPVINIDANGQCCETIPNGILYGNDYGTHELGVQTMCAREFIYYLTQMVENHWRYPPENAGYAMSYIDDEGIGEVDCVGVYRYIMKWYYTEASYDMLFSGNSVYRLFKDGMKGTGELTDPKWLLPGMAVFEYDPNFSDYEYYCWRHVAYYIGYTEEQGHLIIESYSAGKEMRITTLDTSRYNYYGWLGGIDYCVSDIIECK